MEQLSIIRDLLRSRLAVVADREFYQRDPQAHLNQLQQISEALVAGSANLPGETDPMLRHYLERQSYVKALDWLDAHLSDTAGRA